MSDPNQVEVKFGTSTRYKKNIIFLIIHTSSNNLEKKMESRCVELSGDFRMARLRYTESFEYVYKSIE